MAVVPYALTSRDNVKAFVGITDTSKDTLIDSLINGATDFIEGYCGGRRFASTSYVEVKDTHNSRFIFLNQRPATAITKVEYRSGVPSAPVWNTYSADSYLTYLNEGYLAFFSMFKPILQAFRVTYTAGYVIDFTGNTGTLPNDLIQLTNELVATTLNQRGSQGVVQEQTEGQSVQYATDRYSLDNNHKAVLNKYKITRVAP